MKVLPTYDLVPPEWRDDRPPPEWRNNVDINDGDPWVFNPSIIKLPGADGHTIICYRVVRGRSHITGWRRIACAVLDGDFNVVLGSVVPLSEFIEFPENSPLGDEAKRKQADPRLCFLNGRFYVAWNNEAGAKGKLNKHFLLRLDPTTLKPIGTAQELCIPGTKREWEKNWVLFDGADGSLNLVYKTSPLKIYKQVDQNHGAIIFGDPWVSHWNSAPYEGKFGEIRGGAPPVRQGDFYYMFGHSCKHTLKGRRYFVSQVKFTARAPFDVVAACKKPMPPFSKLFGPPGPIGRRWSTYTAGVVFPCGAFIDGEDVHLSMGINDEGVAIASVKGFDQYLEPVGRPGSFVQLIVPINNRIAGHKREVIGQVVRKSCWLAKRVGMVMGDEQQTSGQRIGGISSSNH